MADPQLSTGQQYLLGWLSAEDFSAYGECKGTDLDTLIALRFVEVRPDARGADYAAVSLTDTGRAALAGLQADAAKVEHPIGPGPEWTPAQWLAWLRRGPTDPLPSGQGLRDCADALEAALREADHGRSPVTAEKRVQMVMAGYRVHERSCHVGRAWDWSRPGKGPMDSSHFRSPEEAWIAAEAAWDAEVERADTIARILQW